jgi:hypothetical protein
VFAGGGAVERMPGYTQYAAEVVSNRTKTVSNRKCVGHQNLVRALGGLLVKKNVVSA